MASKASPSTSANRSGSPKDTSTEKAEESGPTSEEIGSIIESLKALVADERFVSIKERMKENRNKLASVTSHLQKLSMERRNSWINIGEASQDLLKKRQDEAVGMHSGFGLSNGDRDSDSYQEDSHGSTAVLLGTSIPPGKNSVRPIKLPGVKKLPPYTTWIFLDRNQRMTEDQSVVGRRRIYYDSGEAVICSDSEEEAVDEEEEKRFFLSSEDYIIRMTLDKTGLSNGALQSLAECLSRSKDEVKARYESLTKEEKPSVDSMDVGSETQTVNSILDKDLEAALDSFDNLFCRRCLVFDCRLHGCSQDLVFPVEKPLPWNHPDIENVPCGSHCYKSVSKSGKLVTLNSPEQLSDTKENSLQPSGTAGIRMSVRNKSTSSTRKKVKPSQSESASSNVKNMSESSDSEIGPQHDTSSTGHLSPSKNNIIGKGGISHRNSKRVAERVLSCIKKRQKKLIGSDSDSVASGGLLGGDATSPHKEDEDATSSSKKARKSSNTGRSRKTEFSAHQVQGEVSSQMCTDPPGSSSDDTLRKDDHVDGNKCNLESNHNLSWKPFEKSMFEKGVEIFGWNSCLITRNLLNGLKTCTEVYHYMTRGDNKLGCQAGDAANSLGEGYSKFEHQGNNEVRRRSRFLRRRGKVRRLKYSWKSTAYHSIRKRISDKKDQPCRQYNPCGCQAACGKQCACLLNGTCCEKYCGCPKSCKNRFRGCHCAKSQCRSRQCPCFAADRECDPDVCRNCWVGCGDGSLGVPNQSGDNYECRNMKLLLKQQQRVLLGRSNISGWGAFLKNSVGKHDYLGEYTGELISHREADKRGKIYDRENSSFLFNLNDQFVLDAYRKGDKLKFANHSPDPNCYAKVIMVAGDHRVGIFAKERIGAGEELFYDYRYEPDRAPAWARKPEASGSKREETGHTSGRAKKLA